MGVATEVELFTSALVLFDLDRPRDRGRCPRPTYSVFNPWTGLNRHLIVIQVCLCLSMAEADSAPTLGLSYGAPSARGRKCHTRFQML